MIPMSMVRVEDIDDKRGKGKKKIDGFINKTDINKSHIHI